MTTINKIDNKITEIKQMCEQVKSLESQMDKLIDAQIKEGHTAERHIEWCNAYETERKIEAKAKRAIRSLANDLNFEIQKQDYMELFYKWENVLEAIENRWNLAKEALFNTRYTSEIKAIA